MARTMLAGHVSRALDFYNKDAIYYGFGRSTPWEDELKPPTPGDRDEIEGLIGLKKVESKFLVVPDDNGELSYQGQKWKICNPENAIERGARWVYCLAKLSYAEFPSDVSFRQVGLYTSLKHTAGDNQYAIRPEQVTDLGILEVLDNRKPIYREPTQQEQLVLVIQF